MRRPIVAGNWKLNGSRAANASLLSGIASGLPIDGIEVIACPTFVYLAEVVAAAADSGIAIGAQNVSTETNGAFTGEVSAEMVKEVGCSHAIVGHSERRSLYGETDEAVAAKFLAARGAGLVPILCVGETWEERQAGKTDEIVQRQLGAVLDQAGAEGLDGAVIAYEPVWAIGTGQTATPEQAQEVHAGIRAQLAGADARIAAETRILYGGSVKGANAADLFSKQDIDGGLIGGASLDAQDFLAICKAAAGTDS